MAGNSIIVVTGYGIITVMLPEAFPDHTECSLADNVSNHVGVVNVDWIKLEFSLMSFSLMYLNISLKY